MLNMYPDLPRKQRETRTLLEHAPALFIIGIGSVLKDGYPHEMRAADYDDWVTETIVDNGEQYHGLFGDILVWNPVADNGITVADFFDGQEEKICDWLLRTDRNLTSNFRVKIQANSDLSR